MDPHDSPASPAPPVAPASPASPARRHNERLGFLLFVIYLLLYCGFVLINAFAAEQMDRIVLLGLNLAIVYGFGLIVAAVVMAFVYGAMCRNESEEDQ